MSSVGPTCATCQSIHGNGCTVAVGRFDPAGVHGYRSRTGGPLRPTRVEAEADFCQAQRGASEIQEAAQAKREGGTS